MQTVRCICWQPSGRSGDQLEDVVRWCHCVLVSGRMWRMLSPASWYISSSTPVTRHRVTCQDTAQRRSWTFSKYGMETRQKVTKISGVIYGLSGVSLDTPGVSIFQKQVIQVTKSGDTPLHIHVKLLQQSGVLTESRIVNILDTPKIWSRCCHWKEINILLWRILLWLRAWGDLS